MMSIRYKMFAAFCIVIALACGLAFYGIRGIASVRATWLCGSTTAR